MYDDFLCVVMILGEESANEIKFHKFGNIMINCSEEYNPSVHVADSCKSDSCSESPADNLVEIGCNFDDEDEDSSLTSGSQSYQTNGTPDEHTSIQDRNQSLKRRFGK